MGFGPAQLKEIVVTGLAEVMASERFEPSKPLDRGGLPGSAGESSSSAVWFAVDNLGVPNTTKAVTVDFMGDRKRGLGVAPWAFVVSDAVENVLNEMPSEVLTKIDLRRNFLGSAAFMHFVRPRGTSEIWVSSEEGAERAVSEFRGLYYGPVEEWFARFGSPETLLEYARKPSVRAYDRVNPNPLLLRAAAVLSVVNGLPQEAAELVAWYLRRDGFHNWDSVDRAEGFDAAMIERFPDYARARGR